MEVYYLYILYSPTIDQYYIGISHDPPKRLLYHNSSPKGWTKRGRPWKIVFSKRSQNKREAQKWERKIKAQKRKDIISLIIENKFNWSD
ncbi:MAG: GIY-YIG nuclease family protein [Calditrichia bacterium]|nr:GIY-YIG nuclease family protein [Calditrichia bacterium]